MDDFTCPSFTLLVFWVPRTLEIRVLGYPELEDTSITVTSAHSSLTCDCFKDEHAHRLGKPSVHCQKLQLT